jgi:hypothetical protein
MKRAASYVQIAEATMWNKAGQASTPSRPERARDRGIGVVLGYGRRGSKANDLRGRDRDETDLRQRKEKMLDKTIADSFPASDPPSSIPDPEENSFSFSLFCRDFRVVFLCVS